jgi:hypothetical protein
MSRKAVDYEVIAELPPPTLYENPFPPPSTPLPLSPLPTLPLPRPLPCLNPRAGHRRSCPSPRSARRTLEWVRDQGVAVQVAFESKGSKP